MTSSACIHGGAPLRSALEIATAMQAAEAACIADGETWTAPRDRVYRLLLASRGSVKAYDLIAQFNKDGRTKPPTVYRALDFLMARGLVHRLQTEAAYVSCGQVGAHDRGAGFIIYDCCGGVEELELDESKVRSVAAANGFSVTGTVMEAHGTCPRCGPAP